ncbi:putative carboxypeptidase S1 [Xylariales sp. PMI_506]|nr:putative carboxypeptidase S1 [Xylariales sp. PMI_506]
MVLIQTVATWVALTGLTIAAPSSTLIDKRYIEVRDDVEYNVFEHAATGSKLSYVKNSGICETTPGVNQYSGYISVGSNMNMWFWFFEARNNPSTAPLATWFNGGPGCSSMIGLFQENGPCQFYDNKTEPSLNPYSFNTYANMLYVDQPIGVGFSYGDDTVKSTLTAAPFVWTFWQAFFAEFPQYESRDFGLFTESYGGHYGPEFSHYIQEQNAEIAAGKVKGEKINLVALGINNGLYDSKIQEKANIEFARNNTYRALISDNQADRLMKAYERECLPALNKCDGLTGNDLECLIAGELCQFRIDEIIQIFGDFDVYDIRQPRYDDPYPPTTYQKYLARPAVVKAIGANATYTDCSSSSELPFLFGGDEPRSFVGTLSEVVQSGIQVLTWAGDADYICNWFGNLDVANNITFSGSAEFAAKELAPYTVNGTEMGQSKSVNNLHFLRVYEAGHEVPYYQPQLALQAFTQIMQGKGITST